MAKRVKTGGRVKGTPNKTTAKMKEFIVGFLGAYMSGEEEGAENGLGSFAEDWKKLKPSDRIYYSEKFSQYVMPKMSSVDVDADISQKVQTTTERLVELSKVDE